jgi:predicted SAM-dependent methyltransferase
MRLHIGSGPVAIAGWTNVDINAWPGVDVALDVRQPWPFSEVELIFAEHFLEHLTLADGVAFLRSCRGALRADGVLRLSTPNLDWVWLTHYKQPEVMTAEEQLAGCLEMNRAFHGWGHQFLYNRRTLGLALAAAGFATVVDCQYGESTRPELRGLERHERHRDLPGAPSVLVIEARGTANAGDAFDRSIVPYVRDFAAS